MKKIIVFLFAVGFYFNNVTAGDIAADTSLFSDFAKYAVDKISPGELQQLPLGISQKIGNTSFDFLITRAAVYPDYIDADIFLRVTSPSYDGEQKYFFGCDSVKISANGFMFREEIRLGLLSEQQFSLKGEAMTVKLKGDKYGNNLPQTYIVLDCDGLKEISIVGEVAFSNSLIVPVNLGKASPNGRVVASFDGNALSFDDLLLTVHIPEFEVVGFPDWRFKAGTAILDLSTVRNAEAMQTYTAAREYLPADDSEKNLWTGVFLRDITVTFPPYINSCDIQKPPALQSENFWIDEKGITGTVAALNILPKETGCIGGSNAPAWGFSIDKFELAFVQNKLIRGTMDGVITLPVSKNNAFGYTTTFQENGKWFLKVKPDERMKFDMFNANDVMLSNTSYISVTKYPSVEMPELTACLTGKMKVNPFGDSSGFKKFNFGTIEFSSFKITNKEGELPVSIGKLKFDKEIKFGGFPASIDDITFSYTKKELSLAWDIKVHFTGESAGNFIGSTGLKLSAIPSDSGYKYNGFELTDISIDFSNAAFAFKGGLKYYKNHYIYGDGFDGDIDFNIVPLHTGVKAKAMFGHAGGEDGGYPYWYVDILAQFGTVGFPIFPGFKCTGIGGGAYYQMALESNYQGNKYGEGISETGLRYYPDSSKSIGAKLSMEISTAASDILKGLASVDVGFNKHSGLDHITLQLSASFLPPSDFANGLNSWAERVSEALQPDLSAKRKKTSSSSIAAAGTLSYVFPEKAFYGSLETYLNMGVLKGAGSEGLLGKMSMYFGPEFWHIKVGEPTHSLAAKIKFGQFEVKANTYFMTGSNLPPMPAVPAKVERLFKNEQTVSERDISSLKGGGGVVLGGSLGINTGKINLLGAYAELNLETGFDLMMKNYADTVLCVETGLLPGLNGWYANGQMYAYILGDVGLMIKIFGKERSFSLGQIETAAMLKAGLPNPAFLEGQFGVNYSVLNGLVRGYHVFEFELGDKCEL
ncbi:MAG: hypothetical protein LBC49_01985 [Bacteroidales bacterium]|jgi:hypothetical protein|nr:hypothetical protein [Bacteroidales bacterium]